MAVLLNGTNGLIQAYDYQVLTTGFSYVFAAGTQTLVLNPAGTLATGTITMPASPSDGMTITISSTKQITALTLNGNTGQTIIGGVNSLAPYQVVSFIYRSASTTWFPMTTQVAQATGPAFAAYINTAQSLTGGVWTKMQLNAEEFDTAGCFDSTTNYRFTPTVAGYYQINCSAGSFSSTYSGANYVAIYKNGSLYRAAQISTYGAPTMASLVYLNGSTDYVESYANLGTSQNLNASSGYNYMNGALVRTA